MNKWIQDEFDAIDEVQKTSLVSLDTKVVLLALKLIARLLYMIYMEMK